MSCKPTSSSQPQSNKVTDVDALTMASPPSLTLILAATPSLGIGKGGGLPWPQLKKEMGYFARVTKRVSTTPTRGGTRRVNAVLMGRRTWDSIPPKFRPLKDRLNIVLTRKPEEFEAQLGKKAKLEGPFVAGGIADALAQLQHDHDARLSNAVLEIDRVFVIGGASIYGAALELAQTKHVLLTKIKEEYECDTFFPADWEERGSWTEAGKKGFEEFTGEQIVDEEIEEQGIKFEFCLFERENGGNS